MARVLVTGATGFTGRFVVRRLAEAGDRLTRFVRSGNNRADRGTRSVRDWLFC